MLRYWNEVFNFKEPLDPNLVKVLIATESSFRTDPAENTMARSLMQGICWVFVGSNCLVLNVTLGFKNLPKTESLPAISM